MVISISMMLASCVEADSYDNSPSGNFEALWRIIDEKYCFFEEKEKLLGVNWNEVHARYSQQARKGMSNVQLFELLANMIGELKDGHVNLSASFDLGRNWSWKEDYPANFSDTLQRKYLGTDYHIASGIKYRVLDDNIGYMHCSTFENGIGAGNLDDILYRLAPCNGLILDIRNNGGGMVTSAEALASRFTNKEVTIGYIKHKTGPRHDDFSAPEPKTVKPGMGVRWQKPVVVLTNRSVFSAANDFVQAIRAISRAKASGAQIAIVGDTTGGGAGMPLSSELPNGWAVRFSACPMYDENRVTTEHGIDPDYKVSQTDEDFLKGKDTLIEYARKLLITMR